MRYAADGGGEFGGVALMQMASWLLRAFSWVCALAHSQYIGQTIVCISGTVDKIAAADVHIAAGITVIGGSSLLGKAMESLLSNTP